MESLRLYAFSNPRVNGGEPTLWWPLKESVSAEGEYSLFMVDSEITLELYATVRAGTPLWFLDQLATEEQWFWIQEYGDDRLGPEIAKLDHSAKLKAWVEAKRKFQYFQNALPQDSPFYQLEIPADYFTVADRAGTGRVPLSKATVEQLRVYDRLARSTTKMPKLASIGRIIPPAVYR